MAFEKLDYDPDTEDPMFEYYPIPQYETDDEDESSYKQYLEENQIDPFRIDDKTTYRLNWDAPLYYTVDEYSKVEDANYIAVIEGGIGPDVLGLYENHADPKVDPQTAEIIQGGVDRNFDGKIDAADKYPDTDSFDGFIIPAKDTPNELRAFKTDRIVYSYREFDKNEAKWSEYKQLEVYPDTTVWYKDFSYSYNEPMHNQYFWHDAYAEYPVVGVSYEQAKAFAHWRTMYKNRYLKKSNSKNTQRVASYRLPSEAEWEYAARGGIESGTYPWGGPYTTDAEGCFLANFKPNRGDYAADNALYTVEAKSYWPNDYGLYNMAGNVSEWTESSYDKGSYNFDSGLNPNISDSTNLRKVIRGGSWKDVSYFLRVSTRDYEYKDEKRSYIGFRTVQDYLGEDGGDERNQNKIF